ncbi:hypothetical protein [Spirochaeta africana]|uniref:Uncharacterized protein n=1 Tax=Spirochaeta africana (strain ATCC 700263 / DSM 8902 / Z-7692) TaxID=889378 RepID=H9UF40_SPIAZ|nr:hypothetical protein [Spirochaeta africana]AFG36133.1 hypothetical protein Spiaf_0024 [Spirochaeta africana DSM 8902]
MNSDRYAATPLACILLLAGILLLTTSCAGPFDSLGSGGLADARERSTVYIDFSEYRGSRDTMPANMFVTGSRDSDGEPIGSGYDPFTGVHLYAGGATSDTFDGLGAYTAGDDRYAFGIRERGAADLRDLRLFYEFTNTTEYTIIGFEVSYAVELWYHGQRDNQIRLKYFPYTTGFGDLADIIATPNPRLPDFLPAYGPDSFLDGRHTENRIAEQQRFLFRELQKTSGAAAGISPLYPGETGYLRWQYSNGEITTGTRRSGLAIASIQITPIFREDTP